ncbi:MAG: NADH:flavin oxidoreductase/NADH oxidase [SAR202 cluster bacterium]|nr:NADH:flavin oxidoreductase/NADH oxidase [SAR202 cluster bacterium]
MSKLFSPIEIRGLVIPNRVFYSPMCEYSCDTDGLPTDWHMVHLGSKAIGGAGIVMAEATAVTPEGRLTSSCPGIWSDAHVDAWRPITKFIDSHGSIPAIQIAHGGRKASYTRPWDFPKKKLEKEEGGWQIVGPSSVQFDDSYAVPHELSKPDITDISRKFAEAAERAIEAGFKVIELHFAHGYLASSFMSPLSNYREDEYGGSLENRCRFALETIQEVRKAISESTPLFVRISSVEFVEGGWTIDDSIKLAKWMKKAGVDLVDASGGGNSANQIVPQSPGYQVPFADAIRREAEIMTAAVGLITEARQAEDILTEGRADAVFIGREMMRNPYWPLYAQAQLDGKSDQWPIQYERSSFDATYAGPKA